MATKKTMGALLGVALLAVAGTSNALTFTNVGCALDPAAPDPGSCQPGQVAGAGTGTLILNSSRTIAAGYTDVYKFDSSASAADGLAFTFNFSTALGNQVSKMTLTFNGGAPILVAAGSSASFTAALLATDNILKILVEPAGTGFFQNSAGYTAALTAVPLPAAAWLFISALGSMVLVGRRRRIHAATA